MHLSFFFLHWGEVWCGVVAGSSPRTLRAENPFSLILFVCSVDCLHMITIIMIWSYSCTVKFASFWPPNSMGTIPSCITGYIYQKVMWFRQSSKRLHLDQNFYLNGHYTGPISMAKWSTCIFNKCVCVCVCEWMHACKHSYIFSCCPFHFIKFSL